MSLLLGFLAALAWGLHDLCVRYISQKSKILPALLSVLILGTLISAPIVMIWGEWDSMTTDAYRYSLASGFFLAFSSLSLYGAFIIGPVRLVAPIIGAYPILSVGWAALKGEPIPNQHWGAIIAIIIGISIVASLSDKSQENKRKNRAIFFAILSGFSFFATLAFSQHAARIGAELPVLLITRLAAITLIAFIMITRGQKYRPSLSMLPIFGFLGFLDALALGLVIVAGVFPNPEFAAVSSSLFGIITIILARIILKEPMTLMQWSAVILIFLSIGYLGL